MADLKETLASRGIPQGRRVRMFRQNPASTPLEELRRFLQPFATIKKSEIPLSQGEVDENGNESGDPLVDVEELCRALPEGTEAGANNAKEELTLWLNSFPPRLRSKGVSKKPRSLVALLMDRTEFLSGLGEGLVRTCAGKDCAVYNMCPFKEEVQNFDERDGLQCMVDRGVIKRVQNGYIKSPEYPDNPVDPRRSSQMMLFEQLVTAKVRQHRISMHLQQNPVLEKQWEILRKKGGVEQFEAKNRQAHPLLKSANDIQMRIQQIITQMGLSPEFRMRQGLWEGEDERLDTEERAKELMAENLDRMIGSMRKSLPASTEHLTEEERERKEKIETGEELLEDLRAFQAQAEEEEE